MLWYVHHHGNGHWRRAVAVAACLRSHVVLASSRQPPWPLPPQATFIELPPDTPPVGHVDATAGGALHWAPRQQPGLLARHRALLAAAHDASPTCAVVDVSVEVAVLLRVSGIPVTLVELPGVRDDAPHRLARDLADRVLIPVPADWGLAEAAIPVGLVTPLARLTHPPVDPKGPIVVVTGAGGSSFTEGSLASLRAAAAPRHVVVAAGGHDMTALLASASVVIGSAGLGTVADVAAAERPFVAIAADRPHGEQFATARAMRAAGVAVVPETVPDRVDQWAAAIAAAVAIGPMRADTGGAERFAALVDSALGETAP